MQRRHRAIATVAFVAIIMLGIIPPRPAAAYTDWANTPPTGWTMASTSTPFGNGDNMHDADDSTFEGAGLQGGQGCSTVDAGAHRSCQFGLTYTRTSGQASPLVFNSFRMLYRAEDGAWPPTLTNGTGLELTALKIYDNEGAGADTLCYSDTVTTTAYRDTGQTNMDTPCSIESGHALVIEITSATNGGAGAQAVWSFEAISESIAPEEVNITEYLYGLRLDHPPFERVIYWEWAVDDCGGSWSIVDEDDDVFGGDFLNCAGDYVGQYERIVIECPVVCGHDVYLITINDTTNNRVAYYEIDSDESGELIPDSTPPVITSFTGCYNASTDQCVGIRADLYTAQAAGTLQLTYSFTGDPANVTIGQDDITLGLWYMDGGGDTIDAQVEGWYRVTDTTVNEALSPTFNIYMENFATEYAWAQVTVDFGSGGHVEIIPPSEGPDEDENGIRDCSSAVFDLGLIACRLGQLIDVLGGVAAGVINDLWGPSIGAVRAAASEKLPFAYMVLAVDGASTQLARLADEVENSDDCDGVTFNVPLGIDGISPTATSMPMVLLTCEQLEPFMGTTWFQAIRTALDPALWLLFGWSQFKALQPKTSLSG